jgi:secreted trypsin-like serine protease
MRYLLRFVSVAALLAASALAAQPAVSVTNPRGFVSGIDFPWAASLWVGDGENLESYQPYCSAAVIAPRWMVTAAHCIKGIEGDITAVVGSDSLIDTTLLGIDGLGYHPRYSAGSLQNDIGLVFLSEPVPGPYLKLPPSNDSKLVGAKSGMRLYAWGLNQNRDEVPFLAWTVQKDFSAAEAKRDKSFNRKTMIAGHLYDAKERQYSGACNGDSGGPLVSSGKPAYLLGITSYGTSSCFSSKNPSVYTRVNYYNSWILTSIKQTELANGLPAGSTLPGSTSTPSTPSASTTKVYVTGSVGSVNVVVTAAPATRVTISCVSQSSAKVLERTLASDSLSVALAPGEYRCQYRATTGGVTGAWVPLPAVFVS